MPDRNRDEARMDRRRGDRRSAYPANDYFYGSPHTQRVDWSSRSFDNNPGDRREGMYEAGGSDFAERARDAYVFGSGAENDFYKRDYRPNPTWTGGDRGYNERHEERPRFIDSVKNFFGVGPKGYRRSDERIYEDVCEALARHPEVDASNIEVSVKDGQVTLSGTVPNRWMKRQAEDVIDYLPGVEDVLVNLTLPSVDRSAMQ